MSSKSELKNHHGIEPDWRSGRRWRYGEVPTCWTPWLFDTGSLTQRLRQASGGEFRVALLSSGWQRPMACERRLLSMGVRDVALVRQVHLLCRGEVKVYARTVIPIASLTGANRSLAHLGGRPLGERLFRDKSMRRHEVQVARIERRHRVYDWALATLPLKCKTLWGRRSLFELNGKPLLVSEIYLPPPLPQTGPAFMANARVSLRGEWR